MAPAIPRQKAAPKTVPNPSTIRARSRRLAQAAHKKEVMASREGLKRALPPMRPPAGWTTGVVVETDEEGKAPYRASLRNEPLPPGRDTLPPVPDALYRDLVARSLSIAQMARELGVNPTTVQRRLDRMGLRTVQQKNLEFYKRKRADLLAMSQVEILDAITPEKLAAANLEALTRSFGTLYDRERLERGLSTETIDVNRGVSRAGALEELQSRILQRLGVERLPAPPTIEVLESPDAG